MASRMALGYEYEDALLANWAVWVRSDHNIFRHRSALAVFGSGGIDLDEFLMERIDASIASLSCEHKGSIKKHYLKEERGFDESVRRAVAAFRIAFG